jgi:hypothetical protein
MQKLLTLAVLALALIAGTAGTVAVQSTPAQAGCGNGNC